jgi:hypothetical protein
MSIDAMPPDCSSSVGARREEHYAPTGLANEYDPEL